MSLPPGESLRLRCPPWGFSVASAHVLLVPPSVQRESKALSNESLKRRLDLGSVLATFTPGADRSTVDGPQLENDASASLESVAATQISFTAGELHDIDP